MWADEPHSMQVHVVSVCVCILIALWLETDGGQHAKIVQKAMHNNSEMESIWRKTEEDQERDQSKKEKLVGREGAKCMEKAL